MSGGRGPAKRALTRLHTSRVDYDNLVASSSSVGRRNRAHSKRRPDQPGRARKTGGGAVRVSPDPRGTDLGPPSSGAKGLVPETQRGTQGRGFLGPAVAPMRGVTPTPTSSRGSTVRDSALARRGGELDRQSVRSEGGESGGELARLRAELAAARLALERAGVRVGDERSAATVAVGSEGVSPGGTPTGVGAGGQPGRAASVGACGADGLAPPIPVSGSARTERAARGGSQVGHGVQPALVGEVAGGESRGSFRWHPGPSLARSESVGLDCRDIAHRQI